MSSPTTIYQWAAAQNSHGIFEELSAFVSLETQQGHVLDTYDNFTALFQSFTGNNTYVAPTLSTPTVVVVASPATFTTEGIACLPWVNVRDKGAVGDGVTDDTAAILAAQSALPGGIGVIYFPPGNYVSQKIVLQSLQYLLGSGLSATSIILKSGANTALIETANFSTLTGTGTLSTGVPYNFGWSGIRFDGNKSGQSAGCPPVINVYGYYYRATNFEVVNGYGQGFYSEWTSSTTALPSGHEGMEAFIEQFKVYDCGGDGVHFTGPHDSYIAHGTIFRNGSGSGYQNLYIGNDQPTGAASQKAAGGTKVIGVHCWGGNVDYGIRLDCNSAVFTSCYAEGASIAEVLLNTTGCYWMGGRVFSASVNVAGVKGFQLGISGHTVNNNFILGVGVEDCRGGTVDLTYAGSGQFIDAEATFNGTPSASLLTIVTPPADCDVRIRTNNTYLSYGMNVCAIPPTPSGLVTQTANYSMTATDVTVQVNGPNLTITLPPATNLPKNHRVTIKNLNQTTTTIKTPAAGVKIDGTDYSTSGLALSTAWGALDLYWDGSTNWYTV